MGRRLPLDRVSSGRVRARPARTDQHAARSTRGSYLDGPVNPEVLLISAVVNTGDLGPVADEGVQGIHFHARREEWEWIEDFISHYHKVPDIPSFTSRFPDFPLIETTDVAHGVDEVVGSHLRYTLTAAIRPAAERLADNDPFSALEALRESMIGIDRSGAGGRAVDVLRDYDGVLEEATRRRDLAHSVGYSGIPFGFPTLNDRTGGIHPGDLVVWAARLGQGKTWMMCRLATEALLTGRKVSFVSLEQPTAQIVFRIHTLLGRELGYSIRHRDLMQGTNYDIAEYRSFLAELPNRVPGSLVVSDPTRGRVSPFTLASLMEHHKPDVMMVDYITLMQQEGDDWRGARKLSADTKLVASQYEVPIVAAAQINRLGIGGKKPPGVDKLSESDGIGQDSDVVVTMRQMSRTVTQLMVAKNRSGPDGQVFWAEYRPNEGHIEEVGYDEAQNLMSMDAIE